MRNRMQEEAESERWFHGRNGACWSTKSVSGFQTKSCWTMDVDCY